MLSSVCNNTIRFQAQDSCILASLIYQYWIIMLCIGYTLPNSETLSLIITCASAALLLTMIIIATKILEMMKLDQPEKMTHVILSTVRILVSTPWPKMTTRTIAVHWHNWPKLPFTCLTGVELQRKPRLLFSSWKPNDIPSWHYKHF